MVYVYMYVCMYIYIYNGYNPLSITIQPIYIHTHTHTHLHGVQDTGERIIGDVLEVPFEGGEELDVVLGLQEELRQLSEVVVEGAQLG